MFSIIQCDFLAVTPWITIIKSHAKNIINKFKNFNNKIYESQENISKFFSEQFFLENQHSICGKIAYHTK